MTDPELMPLPALRVAARSFTITDPAGNPMIGQVFGEVWDAFAAAGVEAGLPVAWYLMAADRIDCWVGYVSASDVPGTETFQLPAVEQAAVVTHHGEPSGISAGWMRLGEWVAANGFRPSAPGREIYRVSERGDEANWETDLQQPVVPA